MGKYLALESLYCGFDYLHALKREHDWRCIHCVRFPQRLDYGTHVAHGMDFHHNIQHRQWGHRNGGEGSLRRGDHNIAGSGKLDQCHGN
jgi:hypothetical protein